MIKVQSTLDIAIDLIVNKYNLINHFDIQNKLEEVFEIDTHIDNILYSEQYLECREYYEEEQERIMYKNLTYG